jgi:hypothetical protein
MIETLLLYSLAAYSITFVVASSSLFEPFRNWLKGKTPRLKIGSGKHPIECRMCFGFWVAVAVCNSDWKMILPVYGLAYFMATQERN